MGTTLKEHPLQVLIKVLEKLKATPEGTYLVLFSLSNLRPYNRQTYQVTAYRSEIEKILMRFKAKAFSTRNGDIVALLREATFVEIEKYIPSIKAILPDDPFFNDRRLKSFYNVMNLKLEFNQCLSLLEDMLIEDQPEFHLSSLLPLEAFDPENSSLEQHPIPIQKSTEILSLLKNADLTGFIKRQPIAWIENPTEISSMGQEFYVSMMDFESHFEIIKGYASNPWFFRHLTLSFDKKVIDFLYDVLRKGNTASLNINLNVRSVISSHFYRFIESIKPYNLRLVIELDRLDLVSDYAAFDFARQVLQDRNIEVCLDGIDYYSLQFLNLEQTGVNIIKLFWSHHYAESFSPTVGAVIEEKITSLIEKFGVNGIILARCDSHRAIEFGQRLGIKLFQGRYVDQLLKKK